MIDVVVIISIHLVYNCKYVQHHLGISAVLLTPTQAARKLLSAAATYELFFVSLSPPAESTVFFVFFPSVDTFTKTWGPTDRTDRWTKYTLQTDIQIPDTVKVKFQPSCRLNALYIQFLCTLYCVPVYCHLFYVYSLSLYLSLVSRLQ